MALKSLLGALAFALVVSAIPAASAKQLKAFDGQSVADAFKAAGAQSVTVDTREGTTYIHAKDSRDLKLSAVLKVCNPATACLGLELQYSWALPANKMVTLSSVNKFNREHIFATAVSLRQDKLVLVRYLIADGGIDYQNLVENLKVFMKMTQSLMETVVLVDAPSA